MAAFELDWERRREDEREHRKGGVEWPAAGSEEGDLKQAEPRENEGRKAPDHRRRERPGNHCEERDYREQRSEAGQAGAEALGRNSRVQRGGRHCQGDHGDAVL